MLNSKVGIISNLDENLEESDDRENGERRKDPTPFISRYTFSGKRRNNRRLDDPQKNYYVDRIGWKAWSFFILLGLFSIIDAAFTIYYVDNGHAREVNPIMAFYLVIGNFHFIIVKYTMTVVGALIICLHKKFSLVRELAFTLLGVYITLDLFYFFRFFFG